MTMELTTAERAISAAHDLIIYLRDRGDRSEEPGWRSRAGRGSKLRKLKHKVKDRDWSGSGHEPSSKVMRELVLWENSRLSEWSKSGRMTEEGLLRMNGEGNIPWTLQVVGEAFPHLGSLDKLAVLVAADGVVEENFMTDNRRIRSCIEEIVDLHLRKRLSQEVSRLLEKVAEEAREDGRPIYASILADAVEKKPSRGRRRE